ncbi:MFS general substrate transporter [Aspergillus insuetus]
MAKSSEPPTTTHIPCWRLVVEQGILTQEVIDYPYPGAGTEEDPYVKWFITVVMALATLAVSLDSSAYSGGITQIIEEFHISTEVATLGVSLFVVGFAIGPLLWAPLSEMFGRQILFITTYCALTAFNCAAASAQNSWTLIILRFFAGAFGSSPLTNAGGVIADMFPAKERAIAMSIFAAAPFLGPVIGPIAGGFLGLKAGWRWVMGLLGAFSGLVWIVGALFIPETYAPVLLRHRAAKLSTTTRMIYRTQAEIDQKEVSVKESFKVALSRPWILLFREPIVFLLSLYMAILYGTLFMLFAAYPIVFQQARGWNQGLGALPFLAIVTETRHGGSTPPEACLPPCIVASITIPIDLFWFAWINSPLIHFMACTAAGVPFGFGLVLIVLGILNYLIDAYTFYAASVLAANAVLRSLFGAAFPLFTSYMYEALGNHWASSIPAFLALVCAPFPFLFYKYGAAIRRRCKYAAESDAFIHRLHAQVEQHSLSMEHRQSQESAGDDTVADDPDVANKV